ncbi:hypothetical protein L1049_006046 [Liquidambar formosana]|uniref:RING-type domain-containing protein n=1 Tax=Liquidambar formosana TaxID=63359 RepID=A0AAP0RGE7_LIQFO
MVNVLLVKTYDPNQLYVPIQQPKLGDALWKQIALPFLISPSSLADYSSAANLAKFLLNLAKRCLWLWDFLKHKEMGLSHFPTAAEGVLPVLVMNTLLSVALLKNIVRSVLQVMGAAGNSPNLEEDPLDEDYPSMPENARERRISITQFKSLCHSRSSVARRSSGGSSSSGSGSGSGSGSNSGWPLMECCVCLCGFEADEEVSELSCKHFFHKGCLEKWFHNKHTTCPLCRSIE